jgi:DNA-binding MltR family transcriptional regulator
MYRQSIFELVPLLETNLGLEQGFFESLDSDDEHDWSFVIKAHALMEAAVSHLLTEASKRPELADIFSLLDMSNKATGKVAFVKALGLLDEKERRFVSAFSELRNRLVHDVRNVGFDLQKHVESLSAKEREIFRNNFNIISTEVTNDVKNLFHLDPRQALWYSVMAFLGIVYLKTQPRESFNV